jgi:hypothetical protein
MANIDEDDSSDEEVYNPELEPALNGLTGSAATTARLEAALETGSHMLSFQEASICSSFFITLGWHFNSISKG